MTTIAKLDKKGRLIGLKKLKGKAKPREGDVEVDDECDLPHDGTYKWDAEAGAFIPLGHGFGCPARPPISEAKVLYLIAQELGKKMPQEVRDWCTWYENNMQRREEEEGTKS